MAEEEAGYSDGLECALAGKGVFVKDKAFRNLNACALHQHGATITRKFSITTIFCIVIFAAIDLTF